MSTKDCSFLSHFHTSDAAFANAAVASRMVGALAMALVAGSGSSSEDAWLSLKWSNAAARSRAMFDSICVHNCVGDR